MTSVWKAAAPATGQPKTQIAASTNRTTLVATTGTANGIKFSETEPRGIDTRAGRNLVRYTSDPATGIWRVVRSYPREFVSPLALQRITVGRNWIEIELIHPKTKNVWTFEGDIDNVATLLWRAGQRYGCQAERKTVFWALYEFTEAARRQAAARGGSL